MTWIDEIEKVQEAKQASTQRVTRGEKISRAIGSLAVSMAKRQNDQDYKQMKKYLELYRKYKSRITRKYGPRVRSKARK